MNHFIIKSYSEFIQTENSDIKLNRKTRRSILQKSFRRSRN